MFFELDRFLVQGAKGNIQKFYFFHANCPSSFIAFSKSMSVIYEYLHSQLSALQVFIQVWLYLTDPTSPYFDISTVCRPAGFTLTSVAEVLHMFQNLLQYSDILSSLTDPGSGSGLFWLLASLLKKPATPDMRVQT